MTEINTQNPENGIDPIENYGNDLTELARQGKVDPVIGRDDEIRRITQIISRRKRITLYSLENQVLEKPQLLKG